MIKNLDMSPAHILYIIFTKGPIAPKPLKNKTKQLKKIPSKKAETLTYEAVVSKEWGRGGERPFEHLSAHSNRALMPLFLPPP